MLTFLAAILSGLLWLGGTGLHPVAALTWLAPLPLLAAALRVRAPAALATTVVAWLIGQAGVFSYYHATLGLPVPAVAGITLIGAVLAAGTVLSTRALLLCGRVVTAVLAVPALWTLGEYVVSRLLPHGAWWSLAYTQAGVRPVIAVTALTGVWGVTYLLLAVPIGLAAMLARPRTGARIGPAARLAGPVTAPGHEAADAPSPPRPAVGWGRVNQWGVTVPGGRAPDGGVALSRPTTGWGRVKRWGVTKLRCRPPAAVACLLVLVLAVGGWSAWLLGRDTTGALTVGLVALEQSDDGLPIDQASGAELLARYQPRVSGLVQRGARIVVLPEKVFGVTGTTLPRLVDGFRSVTSAGVVVVVGAVLRQGGTASNVALVLGAGGSVRTYAKQHLIPGLEDDLTPGRGDLVVDGRFGVAVCKDVDFPQLVRRYRSYGATLLLVPALDFDSDGWLHSRMALVRGVEDGLTVVRAAGSGRLTVTDPGGRVRGEAVAGNADLLVTVAPAADRTAYARFGDWFPAALVPLLALALLGARRSGAGRGPATAGASGPAAKRPESQVGS